MNNINDEILNKLIDNEITGEEKEVLLDMIEGSDRLKNRYNALLKAHQLLRISTAESTSINFTKLVMAKIHLQKVREEKQKHFLFGVLSFLGLIILAIIAFILIKIFSVTGTESSDLILNYSKNVGDYFSDLFGKKNIAALGSVLSLIMFISAYFLYDFQRKTRKNFSH